MSTSVVLKRWPTTAQGKSLHSAESTVESGVSQHHIVDCHVHVYLSHVHVYLSHVHACTLQLHVCTWPAACSMFSVYYVAQHTLVLHVLQHSAVTFPPTSLSLLSLSPPSLSSLSLPSTPLHPAAMATIARHVIANEYSLADESVKTVSDSHESTPHLEDPRTRLEESGREDSPSSTTSSQEPCDSTVVSIDCTLCVYRIYSNTTYDPI